MVERKVGEVFCLSTGARLLVRPGGLCKECHLFERYQCTRATRGLQEEVGDCLAHRRSDRTAVVFVHELDWTLDEILKGGLDGKE